VNAVKGIYILIISVDKNVRINIGALGPVDFEEGMYAYVGSAQNSLESRVERHFRKNKRRFWHIDYLLGNGAVSVLKVFYRNSERNHECRIARETGEGGVAINGFGSSDCRCKSHLFRLESYSFLKEFMQEMPLQLFGRQTNGEERLVRLDYRFARQR
jgi:Uri superfamily endonuclease